MIDLGVMWYGYLQASAFATLVGATAIIPYIIYFLITVAYAVKRRTTDTIPGAFTLGPVGLAGDHLRARLHAR